MSLQKRIAEHLIARNQTLLLVETTTGGLLTSQFVALPGASKYLLGSLVAYSNDFKRDVLPGSMHWQSSYGAVSPQFALSLAFRAYDQYTPTYVVAESGIAPYREERRSRKKPGQTYYSILGGPHGYHQEFHFENYDETNRWLWMGSAVLDILKNTIQYMEEQDAEIRT